MISNRYGQANNKYMRSYNPNEESKYTTYLDASNSYGWGMSKTLPYKDLEWVDDKEVENVKPERIDPNGDAGCILQVNLEYPKYMTCLMVIL